MKKKCFCKKCQKRYQTKAICDSGYTFNVNSRLCENTNGIDSYVPNAPCINGYQQVGNQCCLTRDGQTSCY